MFLIVLLLFVCAVESAFLCSDNSKDRSWAHDYVQFSFTCPGGGCSNVTGDAANYLAIGLYPLNDDPQNILSGPPNFKDDSINSVPCVSWDTIYVNDSCARTVARKVITEWIGGYDLIFGAMLWIGPNLYPCRGGVCWTFAKKWKDVTEKDCSLISSIPSQWYCNQSFYNDSHRCDCECGAWDPDCDKVETLNSQSSWISRNGSRLNITGLRCYPPGKIVAVSDIWMPPDALNYLKNNPGWIVVIFFGITLIAILMYIIGFFVYCCECCSTCCKTRTKCYTKKYKYCYTKYCNCCSSANDSNLDPELFIANKTVEQANTKKCIGTFGIFCKIFGWVLCILTPILLWIPWFDKTYNSLIFIILFVILFCVGFFWFITFCGFKKSVLDKNCCCSLKSI